MGGNRGNHGLWRELWRPGGVERTVVTRGCGGDCGNQGLSKELSQLGGVEGLWQLGAVEVTVETMCGRNCRNYIGGAEGIVVNKKEKNERKKKS